MKHNVKYSNCWEDAYVLQDGLCVNKGSKILSIASAGDNSLLLLGSVPKALCCIDTNVEQLYLVQLKEEAIRYLEYNDFLSLLGFIEHNDRMEIYSSISHYLTQDCQTYFAEHKELLIAGIIHQGKFEKYFQLFQKRILPLIHTKKRVARLVEPKSDEQQRLFFKEHWNTWRWRLMFKLFFSKWFMSMAGRDKEKFKYVDAEVGSEIFGRTERHFSSAAVQENYLMEYCLSGQYVRKLPPYAMEINFIKIKKWLQESRIQYELTDFFSFKKMADYNCFNLSNIFEYMSTPEFDDLVEHINMDMKSQSRLVYWELFNSRKLDEKVYEKQVINREDYGFFYQSNNCYIKK